MMIGTTSLITCLTAAATKLHIGTTTTTAARSFASTTPSAQQQLDLSQLVSGLTQEQVDADPEIVEYLWANFGNKKENISNGISIPMEVLQEFGVTKDDLQQATRKKDAVKVKKQ